MDRIKWNNFFVNCKKAHLNLSALILTKIQFYLRLRLRVGDTDDEDERLFRLNREMGLGDDLLRDRLLRRGCRGDGLRRRCRGDLLLRGGGDRRLGNGLRRLEGGERLRDLDLDLLLRLRDLDPDLLLRRRGDRLPDFLRLDLDLDLLLLRFFASDDLAVTLVWREVSATDDLPACVLLAALGGGRGILPMLSTAAADPRCCLRALFSSSSSEADDDEDADVSIASGIRQREGEYISVATR